MPILRLFQLPFYTLEKAFFYQTFCQTHLPSLFYLKLQYEKLSNFRPKPNTNPFGKIRIFPLFQPPVLIV